MLGHGVEVLPEPVSSSSGPPHHKPFCTTMRMAKRSPSTDTALASPHSLTSRSLPQPPGITCKAKAKGNSMGLTFFLLLLFFFDYFGPEFWLLIGDTFFLLTSTPRLHKHSPRRCTFVCACVRACVCVCVCHNEKKCQTNGKHDK